MVHLKGNFTGHILPFFSSHDQCHVFLLYSARLRAGFLFTAPVGLYLKLMLLCPMLRFSQPVEKVHTASSSFSFTFLLDWKEWITAAKFLHKMKRCKICMMSCQLFCFAIKWVVHVFPTEQDLCRNICMCFRDFEVFWL